jgi:hypothetical protein
MKNAADIEPSRETSLLNSNAMRGNMADRLNQFIPYTILAIIKENDALASELNILLFFLFERLYTILFLHLYSHILYSPPIFWYKYQVNGGDIIDAVNRDNRGIEGNEERYAEE